eukprot:99922-Pyramimonas_sp.AAC.1
MCTLVCARTTGSLTNHPNARNAQARPRSITPVSKGAARVNTVRGIQRGRFATYSRGSMSTRASNSDATLGGQTSDLPPFEVLRLHLDALHRKD